MVKIRMERRGKRHRPFYRMVVVDSRTHVGGYVLDILGHYDPLRDGHFKVNLERLEYWLSKGAKLTPRAKSIVKLARNKAKTEQKQGVETAQTPQEGGK